MHCSRLLLSFGLFFVAICASSKSYAVEDFRAAIKAIVPHIVLVRRLDEISESADASNAEKIEQTKADADSDSDADTNSDAEDQSESAQDRQQENQNRQQESTEKNELDQNQNLLEALRNRSERIAYQHAFRVAEELIATVDLGSRSSDHRWELLSRDGQWHQLELVGRDNVTKLVLLKGKQQTLDKIADTGPIEETPEFGELPSGELEMGLPTVVVWYEDGAPRAKATMVAATGNVKTRGLAILDFAFRKTQVGAPVLDAQAKLLGVLSVRSLSAAERDAERRFELSEVNLKPDSDDSQNSTTEPVRDGALQTAPKTIIITADSLGGEDEPSAEYVVPSEILNRLLSDVAQSDQPVSLDAGLFGIWLGNGDATIRGLIRGGAAEEADCRKGDKIVSVDGRLVRNDGDILNAIMGRRAGDIVTLELQSPPPQELDKPQTPASTTSNERKATSEIRTVRIKMRAIRARSDKSKSDTDQSQSSSRENSPQSQVRLVGVSDGAASEVAKPNDRLDQPDLEELRQQIEQLLKELSDHDRE